MRITVVIPTHNRHALLNEAIASVEAQSFKEWDIVVVDDGSRKVVDLSVLPSKMRERIRLIRHDSPRGPSGARNSGIQSANGEVVFMLDDDDKLEPDCLRLIVEAFQQNSNLNCLFCNVEPFGTYAEGTRENLQQSMSQLLGSMGLAHLTQDKVILLDSVKLFTALLERIPLTFQRVAILRSQIEKVGLYSGIGFEDLEWYYKVALRGTCGLITKPCYAMRWEGQSYFSRVEVKQHLIDATLIIRKGLLNLEEVSSSPFLKKKVKESLVRTHFNKAYFAHERGISFPWGSFYCSLANGVHWRHFSLMAKVMEASIRKVVARHA